MAEINSEVILCELIRRILSEVALYTPIPIYSSTANVIPWIIDNQPGQKLEEEKVKCKRQVTSLSPFLTVRTILPSHVIFRDNTINNSSNTSASMTVDDIFLSFVEICKLHVLDRLEVLASSTISNSFLASCLSSSITSPKHIIVKLYTGLVSQSSLLLAELFSCNKVQFKYTSRNFLSTIMMLSKKSYLSVNGSTVSMSTVSPELEFDLAREINGSIQLVKLSCLKVLYCCVLTSSDTYNYVLSCLPRQYVAAMCNNLMEEMFIGISTKDIIAGTELQTSTQDIADYKHYSSYISSIEGLITTIITLVFFYFKPTFSTSYSTQASDELNFEILTDEEIASLQRSSQLLTELLKYRSLSFYSGSIAQNNSTNITMLDVITCKLWKCAVNLSYIKQCAHSILFSNDSLSKVRTDSDEITRTSKGMECLGIVLQGVLTSQYLHIPLSNHAISLIATLPTRNQYYFLFRNPFQSSEKSQVQSDAGILNNADEVYIINSVFRIFQNLSRYYIDAFSKQLLSLIPDCASINFKDGNLLQAEARFTLQGSVRTNDNFQLPSYEQLISTQTSDSSIIASVNCDKTTILSLLCDYIIFHGSNLPVNLQSAFGSFQLPLSNDFAKSYPECDSASSYLNHILIALSIIHDSCVVNKEISDYFLAIPNYSSTQQIKANGNGWIQGLWTKSSSVSSQTRSKSAIDKDLIIVDGLSSAVDEPFQISFLSSFTNIFISLCHLSKQILEISIKESQSRSTHDSANDIEKTDKLLPYLYSFIDISLCIFTNTSRIGIGARRKIFEILITQSNGDLTYILSLLSTSINVDIAVGCDDTSISCFRNDDLKRLKLPTQTMSLFLNLLTHLSIEIQTIYPIHSNSSVDLNGRSNKHPMNESEFTRTFWSYYDEEIYVYNLLCISINIAKFSDVLVIVDSSISMLLTLSSHPLALTNFNKYPEVLMNSLLSILSHLVPTTNMQLENKGQSKDAFSREFESLGSSNNSNSNLESQEYIILKSKSCYNVLRVLQLLLTASYACVLHDTNEGRASNDFSSLLSYLEAPMKNGKASNGENMTDSSVKKSNIRCIVFAVMNILMSAPRTMNWYPAMLRAAEILQVNYIVSYFSYSLCIVFPTLL